MKEQIKLWSNPDENTEIVLKSKIMEEVLSDDRGSKYGFAIYDAWGDDRRSEIYYYLKAPAACLQKSSC